jgi:hypothetical protein
MMGCQLCLHSAFQKGIRASRFCRRSLPLAKRRDAGKTAAVFAVARMVGGNIHNNAVGKFLCGGRPTTGHMAPNGIITPQGKGG